MMLAALTLTGCSEPSESPVSTESPRKAQSADELEQIRETVREVCKTLASTDGLLTTFAGYAQSSTMKAEVELAQTKPAKIRHEKYCSATLGGAVQVPFSNINAPNVNGQPEAERVNTTVLSTAVYITVRWFFN